MKRFLTVSLCLLALTGKVPLIFLRPVAAAATITATSVPLLLVAFGPPTVAGTAAQVIVSYRLGRAGESGHVAGAQLLAAILAVAFLVLALASHGGAAAIVLASLTAERGPGGAGGHPERAPGAGRTSSYRT